MNIIKATYGGVDITQKIQNKIKNNILLLRADNSIIGDPDHGHIKYLEVIAEVGGQIIEKKVVENELLVLTNTTTNKLGIFYADNNDPRCRPAILASLKSIQKASNNKADILTSMWNIEPNNPFPEFIAWTQNRSHLNQVLQILQLPYIAKECGNYRYVSFLESDVLYAEGYFDYPEFDSGALCNMNYIGINKDGFQHRNQHDKPLSQLTMLLCDAIDHFINLLPNALRRNSGFIEPKDVQDWNAENSSIHINHGRHFTSHFTIYSKDNTYKDHPYWGNHSQYTELFF